MNNTKMMKNLLIFIFLLSAQFAAAQTISVSGTVIDDEGQPLHFAFVKDIESKAAAYTDSAGNFTIDAGANSRLHVNCFGFKDTLVKIDGRTTINLVMKTAVKISSSRITEKHTLDNDIGYQQLAATMARDNDAGIGNGILPLFTKVTLPGNVNVSIGPNTVDAAQGAIFPQFNPKGETEGSRYFLKGWIHGYVINSKDSTIQDPAYYFAYDKMGGGLLLTKNKVSAIEVDRELVKSFTLYDNTNTAYTFANVPEINATHYVQVLASGNKYNIYKAIKTTFEKDNYATDGVFEQGHNYDLYKDESTYYVYDVNAKKLQQISLKKKSLKVAFAKDADKLDKYLSENSNTIDDFYLANLGATMNE